MSTVFFDTSTCNEVETNKKVSTLLESEEIGVFKICAEKKSGDGTDDAEPNGTTTEGRPFISSSDIPRKPSKSSNTSTRLHQIRPGTHTFRDQI